MKTNHRWSYCEHCEVDMVVCGTCGNNCCNGGYGMINDEDCPDCPSAYKMQDRGKFPSK